MKKDVSSTGSRAMYITMISLVICSLIFSAVVRVNDLFYYLVMPVISCFVFGKFAMAMMFCQGWKVFNRKMILGLPVGIFIFYAVVVGLLMTLTITNQDMNETPDAQKTISVFLFNAWAGVIGSLIAWFAGIKEWMAGGSEYDARMELESKGYSQEVIESKISHLKETGLIPS